MENMCPFIVYRIEAYAFPEAGQIEQNILISAGKEKEKIGICFIPKGKPIRVHGVAWEQTYFDIKDFGRLENPSKLGTWNMVCVY